MAQPMNKIRNSLSLTAPKVAPASYRDADCGSDSLEQLAASEAALLDAMSKFRGPTDEDDADDSDVPHNAPLVEQFWFNVLIGLLVVLNMTSIGLELDYGYQFTNEEYETLSASDRLKKRLTWWMMENVFCLLFLLELFLRIRTYRVRFFFDTLNVIDMGLVFAACIDTYILTFMGEAGNLRVVSALRVFRLIRLVRFLRLLKSFKEIWLIFLTLGNSMRALLWVGLLMFSILYMFAIFLTSYIGQQDELYDFIPADPTTPIFPYKLYFGSVPRSMFTLFQILTLDDWCDGIVRIVAEKQLVVAMVFIVFIILTAFGLLNVIIGVIVENTLSVEKMREATKLRQKAREQKKILGELRELFFMSDIDRSNTLTLQEFKASFESEAMRMKFRKLELPGSDAQEIFSLLDPMRKGHIQLDDFISSCSLLIGGEKMAKNIAQVALQVETLSRRMDALDDQLGLMEGSVQSIRRRTNSFIEKTLPLISGVQLSFT